MNSTSYLMSDYKNFPQVPIAGIYMIKNSINGNMYIGQSINMSKRWKEHIVDCHFDNRTFCIHIALKKYGLENFTVSILESIDIDTPNLSDVLNQKEQEYIEKYDTYYHGYNLTLGGNQYRIYDYSKYEILAEEFRNGLTIYEISKKYGISEPTVSNILNTFGVETKKDSSSFDKKVKKLYEEEDLSIQKIARTLHCSNGCIQRSLVRSNVKMRNPP